MANRPIMVWGTALVLAAACGGRREEVPEQRAIVANGLQGEYFTNATLTGTPAQVRIDQNIDFGWANGSPFPGTTFPSDNFSVRWTGKIVPRYSGTCTFYLYEYDGARLWVNNQLVIDDWAWDEGEESGTITLAANTAYDIKVEYFEGSGAAEAHLSWSSPNQAKEIVPASQLLPPGSQVNGLQGEYFTNATLSGTPDQVRVDDTINFGWANGSPFPGTSFPSDNFSVRWTGTIVPRYSETYTFYLYEYDGARLWVNNQLVIDDWAWDEGEESGTITLSANTAYDIKVEYFEGSGAAEAHLSWSSPHQSKEIVPKSQLFTSGSASGPGPGPDPTPLLTADFENENATCWSTRSNGKTTSPCGIWSSIQSAPASLASNERAHSGTHALKATYTINEDQALARTAVDVDHVFVQFYEYYESSFDFANGMKTLRMESSDPVKQVNNYDIILVVSAQHGPGGENDYCGTNPSRAIFLQENRLTGLHLGPEVNISLVPGRWYRVEVEVKLNTPGAADGETRIWYDGQKIMEATGLNIRGTHTEKINTLGIGGWYSNGAGGQNTCPDPVPVSIRYVDDVVVATQYIGP